MFSVSSELNLKVLVQFSRTFVCMKRFVTAFTSAGYQRGLVNNNTEFRIAIGVYIRSSRG
jgi:hypothetical protein